MNKKEQLDILETMTEEEWDSLSDGQKKLLVSMIEANVVMYFGSKIIEQLREDGDGYC